MLLHEEEQKVVKNLPYLTKGNLNKSLISGFQKSNKLTKQFALPANNRLKGRLLFKKIFISGLSIRLAPFVIKYAFVEKDIAGKTIKLGFAVSKKQFKKAIDRNKIKRLMREAARLNQHQLKPFQQTDKTLIFLILFTGKSCPAFDEVNKKIKLLLNRLNMTYEMAK